MTTQDIINYYANLLIIQYVVRPKAYATIQAMVTPVIMDQLPLTVQAAFNLDAAVGVQLDMIGNVVGVKRNTYGFTGAITLSDADFLQMIRMKIIQNISYSSLYDIQSLIEAFFPSALKVFDYADMHMDYYFDSTYGSSQLAEVFVKQGLLPKPMGVQLGALIYATNLNSLFGFRTYALASTNVTGFQTYSAYQTGRPWLSYANAIVP